MANNKDLRYVRTNQMLCDAFTELLQRKEFEDITIDELCRKAFIRRATFYTHFLDKYDFFAYFIRQNGKTFSENWNEPEETKNMMSFSTHMFQETIHYLTEHMSMVQNILNSSAFSILLDILAEQIKTSLLNILGKYEVSPFPTDIHPEIIASYYAGGIIQILRYWIASQKAITEEELVKQYSSLMKVFWMEVTVFD